MTSNFSLPDEAWARQVASYTLKYSLCGVERRERGGEVVVDIRVCLGCRREACPPGYENRMVARELERRKQSIRG